jgi:hypothetical protein
LSLRTFQKLPKKICKFLKIIRLRNINLCNHHSKRDLERQAYENMLLCYLLKLLVSRLHYYSVVRQHGSDSEKSCFEKASFSA